MELIWIQIKNSAEFQIVATDQTQGTSMSQKLFILDVFKQAALTKPMSAAQHLSRFLVHLLTELARQGTLQLRHHRLSGMVLRELGCSLYM